jgi:hypothetical protein
MRVFVLMLYACACVRAQMKMRWARERVNAERLSQLRETSTYPRSFFSVHPNALRDPEVGALVIDLAMMRRWRAFMRLHIKSVEQMLDLDSGAAPGQGSLIVHSSSPVLSSPLSAPSASSSSLVVTAAGTHSNGPTLSQFLRRFRGLLSANLEHVHPALQRSRVPEPDLEHVLPQYTDARTVPVRCKYVDTGVALQDQVPCGDSVVTMSSGTSMFACDNKVHQEWATRTYFMQRIIGERKLLSANEFTNEGSILSPIVQAALTRPGNQEPSNWVDGEVRLLFDAISYLSQNDAWWNETDISARWLPGRQSAVEIGRMAHLILRDPDHKFHDEFHRLMLAQSQSMVTTSMANFHGYRQKAPDPRMLTTDEVEHLLGVITTDYSVFPAYGRGDRKTNKVAFAT